MRSITLRVFAFEREVRDSPISQSKMKIIASITTIRIGTVGNRYTVFAIFHAVEDVSRRYAGIRRDEEHNGADGVTRAHKAVNQRDEDRRGSVADA